MRRAATLAATRRGSNTCAMTQKPDRTGAAHAVDACLVCASNLRARTRANHVQLLLHHLPPDAACLRNCLGTSCFVNTRQHSVGLERP
jgi:hypothetical protein